MPKKKTSDTSACNRSWHNIASKKRTRSFGWRKCETAAREIGIWSHGSPWKGGVVRNLQINANCDPPTYTTHTHTHTHTQNTTGTTLHNPPSSSIEPPSSLIVYSRCFSSLLLLLLRLPLLPFFAVSLVHASTAPPFIAQGSMCK